MSYLTNWMDNNFYSGVQKNWDDLLFRKKILTFLNQRPSIVLDLGAGAGIVSSMNFRGIAEKVYGIDPDTRVVNNPYLDEGKIASGESIPYENNTFDMVFADNVLEHLDNPEAVFSEVRRVLKPGGRLFVKTPNKFHYMPVIASLTPHWFHEFVNKLRGREIDDTFPTRYLVNSPKEIYKVADSVGLKVNKIDLIESRPEYLRIFAATYFFGWIYEKLVNSHNWFSKFRILLIAELQKPL